MGVRYEMWDVVSFNGGLCVGDKVICMACLCCRYVLGSVLSTAR